MDDTLYRDELLAAWEETYKKGQLTLWMFLALKDGPKCVDEIGGFIRRHSDDAISCEDQSLYRALRKFDHLMMVTFEHVKGMRGPDRKCYRLTPLGRDLLEEFINRHIRVFLKPELAMVLNMNQGGDT